MSLIIFFIIVFIYMALDNKVINDDIKECSKIKWTKEDAERYYNDNFNQNK
jgi:Ni,Fe-hydrogenase I cytochrome b subunit